MAILIPIFLVAFASITLVFGIAASYFKSKQKRQIIAMLRNAEASPAEFRATKLIKENEEPNIFTDLLRRFSLAARLDLVILQSGQNTTSSKLLGFSLLLAVVGFIVGSRFNLLPAGLTSLVFAVLAGAFPIVRLLRKRSRTLADFEKQLPEALNFFGRSMRAGHGFSIAMELLADDSPDPLGQHSAACPTICSSVRR